MHALRPLLRREQKRRPVPPRNPPSYNLSAAVDGGRFRKQPLLAVRNQTKSSPRGTGPSANFMVRQGSP
jgi:hypothetical protein